MKKTLLIAFAASATLTLAACGSATDASEDAVADTVEMPADEAMAGTPQPAEDADAMAEATESAEEAAATAEALVEGDAPAAAASEAPTAGTEAE